MAKTNVNKIILLLTVVIAIGAVISVLGFAVDIGIINIQLEERPDQVPPLAEIPFVEDEGTEEPKVSIDPPTTEELIDQFLRGLGVVTVETFGVDASVRLVDSNLEEQIQSSFLKVQPLNPREVIVSPDEEIDPSRIFIKTDFSEQVADNGINFHRFSGWNIVNSPSECTVNDGIALRCPIPVTITTVKNTVCRVDNTGICVQVSGSKNEDDDVNNASYIHGIQKKIDLSDWTKEGELIVEFDYDCRANFQRGMVVIATFRSDFGQTFQIPCGSNQHFSKDVSEFVVNSNEITVEIGARATRVDDFRIDVQFNNIEVTGNSVVKRDAIELLESFSIVQNNDEGKVLDLGFIELKLLGKTLENNESVVVDGVLETRIDGKTLSTHQVTANGVSSMKQIPLKIDGQNEFIFELSKQFFDEGTFHTLKFILNDFIVNVGSGEEQRTFEYHTPYVAYSLEFNVKPDEIVAFSEKDRAISVPVSNTVFKTCGLSSGEDPLVETEVLPPIVDIIQNGFTIATTNPNAGKIQATDPFTGDKIPNTEFCGLVPNLPTNTQLTFKIGNEFHDIQIPSIQKEFFVKCDRDGCTSNIGFVSN